MRLLVLLASTITGAPSTEAAPPAIRRAPIQGEAAAAQPQQGLAPAPTPPTLDDLWSGNASFRLTRSTPVASAGFMHVDAGTRVVVINQTWFLFGKRSPHSPPLDLL